MSRSNVLCRPTYLDLFAFHVLKPSKSQLPLQCRGLLNHKVTQASYCSTSRSKATHPPSLSRTRSHLPITTPYFLPSQLSPLAPAHTESPPTSSRPPDTSCRSFSCTHRASLPPYQSSNPSAPRTTDRGPTSSETTQTDFSALNVLGATPAPTTSVDVCMYDGFQLDSGLQIGEGDGVLLLGSEAFVWRPWMALGGPASDVGSSAGSKRRSIVTGTQALRAAPRQRGVRFGGLVNAAGQWDVPDEAWGVLDLVWPRPDLLIIGTGASIRPLAPRTRTYLQQLGLRIEVLDTRNAASQFNMLATERGTSEVAAALVPIGWGSG